MYGITSESYSILNSQKYTKNLQKVYNVLMKLQF